jgi:hypothetical protein
MSASCIRPSSALRYEPQVNFAIARTALYLLPLKRVLGCRVPVARVDSRAIATGERLVRSTSGFRTRRCPAR